ncbi:hypothetical protein S40293_09524 [Stachybotrys chartarum IBT 40293]|nr:hypothetical protein S40293_09524 [Stachybotrys chartarum IBT 40293]
MKPSPTGPRLAAYEAAATAAYYYAEQPLALFELKVVTLLGRTALPWPSIASSWRKAGRESWKKMTPPASTPSFASAQTTRVATQARRRSTRRRYLASCSMSLAPALSTAGCTASSPTWPTSRLPSCSGSSSTPWTRPGPTPGQRGDGSVRRAVVFAVSIAGVLLVQTMCANHAVSAGTVGSLKARRLLLLPAFATALNATRPVAGTEDAKDYSQDETFNLLTVDVRKVEQAIPLAHSLWTGPISIMVAMAMIHVNSGPTGLVGIAFLFASVLVLVLASYRLSLIKAHLTERTKSRMGLCRATLQSMRSVKYLGWEAILQQRHAKARKVEEACLDVYYLWRNSIIAYSLSLPLLAVTVSFVVSASTGRHLSASDIFSSLAIFNSLRGVISYLPVVVVQLVEARAAYNRLIMYSLSASTKSSLQIDPLIPEAMILKEAALHRPVMSEAEASSTRLTNVELNDECRIFTSLHLTLSRAALVGVHGAPGSGKTSLLEGLSGSMTVRTGVHVACAQPVLCPDRPWIKNATARENITFGLPFEPEWYVSVIRACALQTDFDSWPRGDESRVGGQGIVLSGGQRRRIGIARAIYSRADIVLFDDPLVGLDRHVAKHVFAHAFKGLLAGKCCILVAGSTEFLEQCDGILHVSRPSANLYSPPSSYLGDPSLPMLSLMDQHSTLTARNHGNDLRTPQHEEPDTERCSQRNPALDALDGSAPDEHDYPTHKSVLWKWCRDADMRTTIFLGLPTLLVGQAVVICNALWLTWWVSREWNLGLSIWMTGLTTFAIGQSCVILVISSILTRGFVRKTSGILHAVLDCIMWQSIVVTERIGTGSLVHRCTTDIDTLDAAFTESFRACVIVGAMIFCTLVLAAYFLHYFALVIIPFFAVLYTIGRFYNGAAKCLMTLERSAHSQLNSVVMELLQGRCTIRAHGQQGPFITEVGLEVDKYERASRIFLLLQRWLALRLDITSIAATSIVFALVVGFRHSAEVGSFGLVLTYMMYLPQMLQAVVGQATDVSVGLDINSHFERLLTSKEARDEGKAARRPPPARANLLDGRGTPTLDLEQPAVSFSNASIGNGDDGPLILHDFNLEIPAGQHVAVLGRTGAGKSTLLNSLMRMSTLRSGCISLFGQDLSALSHEKLHSLITVLTQNPVVFPGTIRDNLEPTGSRDDAELFIVLQHWNQRPLDLDAVVDEDGTNLSASQRFVISLARLLLRATPIILLDEPIILLDEPMQGRLVPDEDGTLRDSVQSLLLRSFPAATMVCIAHQTESVSHYDRFLSLAHGRLARDVTVSND